MSTAAGSRITSTYDGRTSTVAPLAPRRERLLSLDVFRGLTIAGMLLVNDPGSWGAIFPPLEHAEWNGWTPTDLIFPFFLFIVGITTHLSLSARRARGDNDSAIVRQILRRGIIIYLLGFAMAMFPFYQWGTIDAIPHPGAWDRIIFRIEHVRILGVLPRIAIVYICAALLTLKTTLRQQILIIAGLLFGYWFAMTLIPVPGEDTIGALLLNTHDRNLAAYLDRAILGTNHTWIGSVTFDPEGPFSTIPAIATAMLGVIAGRWIALSGKPLLERITGLFAAGSIAMMLGLMWNWAFPINKNLWTSSYVIFTAGMACVGDHVDRGLLKGEVVDQATRDLRGESDRGVRGIRCDGQTHLHPVARQLSWEVDGTSGRDLPGGIPAVAAAARRVAGVRDRLCPAVVRDSYRSVQAEYRTQGLTRTVS